MLETQQGIYYLVFTAGESRCIKPKFQVHQQAEFTVKKDDKFKIALLSRSWMSSKNHLEDITTTRYFVHK